MAKITTLLLATACLALGACSQSPTEVERIANENAAQANHDAASANMNSASSQMQAQDARNDAENARDTTRAVTDAAVREISDVNRDAAAKAAWDAAEIARLKAEAAAKPAS